MSSVISDYRDWMLSKGYLSATSLDAYCSDLRQFEIWIIDYRPQLRWSSVSKEDIEDYVSFLVAKEYEFVSINRILASITSIYAYFVHRGMLGSNPCHEVKRLRAPYKTRDSLDMEIIRKVLEQNSVDISTKALISLIVESGLRIGECLSLCTGDINLESCQIRVCGKFHKYRMVFFGSMTQKLLSEYLKKCKSSDKVFPLSRRQYNWDIWHACKPFAGEHKCSPHILRHTFATECLSKGMPMDVLMLTLGHKSIDTTMLYTHCQSSRTERYNSTHAARIA